MLDSGARGQPDDRIGPDGDDVEQLQAVQGVGVDAVPALGVPAKSQYHRAAQAQHLQLLDQLDREVRLALEDVARFEPGPGV